MIKFFSEINLENLLSFNFHLILFKTNLPRLKILLVK